ncbi:hypothetical protein FIU94_15830 [Sulfitobacter sp. THAF37]|uniref:hypothetical protein n=1 Tax=Sulfitobacter sp. THAF37 TaxID=2587855 RepID=UPI0012685675|nr:hypothetical protein [Sulfitobacter sp. THAF37]QFT60298.1 hypothetical protein FIU94_15830 [Sulfitobacter sp. THAF37]
MPRWLWWTPLAVLTVVVGVLLFRQGWIAAQMTETDVIDHYASRYVAEHGGRKTDCHAVPASAPRVWIEVRCGDAVVYKVDRAGRLVLPDPAEPAA